MAKSIRSKWKRKCRAVKRERYGKKELERLKKTLGIADNPENKDVAMVSSVGDIANVKTAQEVKEEIEKKSEETMETDEVKKKFDTRTLRDKSGAYPIWVHPRKIKKAKTKKKDKKNKGKKGKTTKITT